MKEAIKTYTIACLFAIIGILLLLKQCTPEPIDNVLNRGKDTISTHDTIRPPAIVIEGKTKWYPVHDTIYPAKDTFVSNLCDFERVYSDSTSDSSITIYTHNTTIGLLKSSKIDYKLKVPIKIESNHYIHDIQYVSNKWDINIGGEIGGSKTSFDMSPELSVRVKDVTYGYRYGMLNSTHNAFITYRIFKSKK